MSVVIFFIFSLLPAIFLAYLLIKKLISKNDLLRAFCYALGCMGVIFLGSTTQKMMPENIYIVFQAVLEEAMLITFLLLCFRKQLNQYKCVAFAFLFTIIETIPFSLVATLQTAPQQVVRIGFHAMTLFLFYWLLANLKDTWVSKIICIAVPMSIQLVSNLVYYNQFNVYGWILVEVVLEGLALYLFFDKIQLKSHHLLT